MAHPEAQMDSDSDRNGSDATGFGFGRQTASQAEVKQFLQDHELGEFWDNFLHEGIDQMTILPDMEPPHLKSLGLGLGHAIKFQRAVSKWMSQQPEASAQESDKLAAERAAVDEETKRLQAAAASLAHERRLFQREVEALETEKRLADKEKALAERAAKVDTDTMRVDLEEKLKAAEHRAEEQRQAEEIVRGEQQRLEQEWAALAKVAEAHKQDKVRLEQTRADNEKVAEANLQEQNRLQKLNSELEEASLCEKNRLQSQRHELEKASTQNEVEKQLLEQERANLRKVNMSVDGEIKGFINDSGEVVVERNCGHSVTIPKCEESCCVRSPLCGHDLTVSCCDKNRVGAWKCWSPAIAGGLNVGKLVLSDSEAPVGDAIDDLVRHYTSKCEGSVRLVKPCGHEITELFGILGDGGYKAKCTDIVRGALRCGHRLPLPCWQWHGDAKRKIQHKCKAKDKRPCWNAAVCGNTALAVPCGAKGTVCCDALSPWICDAGKHVLKLKLCYGGRPLGCPSCNTDYLENLLKGSESSEDVPKKTIPECFRHLESTFLLDTDEVTRFCRSRRLWLQARLQTRSRLMRKSPWVTKPLQEVIVPVFLVLSSNQMDRENQLTGFTDMTEFVDPDLCNSMQVYACSVQNLKALAPLAAARPCNHIDLLCGYVCVMNPKLKVNWPAKGVQPTTRRGEIVGPLFQQYDAVQSSNLGLQELLIPQPYPIYATHRLSLTSAELISAASQTDRTELLTEPQRWSFQKPESPVVLVPAEAKRRFPSPVATCSTAKGSAKGSVFRQSRLQEPAGPANAAPTKRWGYSQWYPDW